MLFLPIPARWMLSNCCFEWYFFIGDWRMVTKLYNNQWFWWCHFWKTVNNEMLAAKQIMWHALFFSNFIIKELYCFNSDTEWDTFLLMEKNPQFHLRYLIAGFLHDNLIVSQKTIWQFVFKIYMQTMSWSYSGQIFATKKIFSSLQIISFVLIFAIGVYPTVFMKPQ